MREELIRKQQEEREQHYREMEIKEDMETSQMLKTFGTVIQENMPILNYNHSTGEYKFGSGMQYIFEQSMRMMGAPELHDSDLSGDKDRNCRLI